MKITDIEKQLKLNGFKTSEIHRRGKKPCFKENGKWKRKNNLSTMTSDNIDWMAKLERV